MKATAVLILALFLVSPVVAAPPRGADELGQEISALTEAITAQLRLLELYEGMGKTGEAAATKATLLDLIAKQRKAGDRLRVLLGGEEASDEPFAGPTTRRPARPPMIPGSKTPLHVPQKVRQVIDRGLAWLAVHQHTDGYWDCDGWMAIDGLGPEAGPGYQHFDAGVTGLALLAFLGDAQTHRSGDYKQTVKMGLRYLKQIQDPEGCFGPRTDAASFDGATNWIEKMTGPEYGRTGHILRGGAVARPEGLMDRFPASRSEAMTATCTTGSGGRGPSGRRGAAPGMPGGRLSCRSS